MSTQILGNDYICTVNWMDLKYLINNGLVYLLMTHLNIYVPNKISLIIRKNIQYFSCYLLRVIILRNYIMIKDKNKK